MAGVLPSTGRAWPDHGRPVEGCHGKVTDTTRQPHQQSRADAKVMVWPLRWGGPSFVPGKTKAVSCSPDCGRTGLRSYPSEVSLDPIEADGNVFERVRRALLSVTAFPLIRNDVCLNSLI
jgi:hypothetical protein